MPFMIISLRSKLGDNEARYFVLLDDSTRIPRKGELLDFGASYHVTKVSHRYDFIYPEDRPEDWEIYVGEDAALYKSTIVYVAAEAV